MEHCYECAGKAKAKGEECSTCDGTGKIKEVTETKTATKPKKNLFGK